MAEDREDWLNLGQDILDPQPNDGWDGAAGAELREEIYEPYPHHWDYTLAWCRVNAAIRSELFRELRDVHSPEGRDAKDIPAWIIRRALVYLPEQYRQPNPF